MSLNVFAHWIVSAVDTNEFQLRTLGAVVSVQECLQLLKLRRDCSPTLPMPMIQHLARNYSKRSNAQTVSLVCLPIELQAYITSICIAGAGMNLSFAKNGLAIIPYKLYNYHYTGSPVLIGNFDSAKSYTIPQHNGYSTTGDIQVYPNNRRISSMNFKQYLNELYQLGSYIQFPGSTSTFSPLKPKALDTLECEPGMVHTNDYRCDSCGPGTYTPDYGFRRCLQCPIGTYSNVSSLDMCIDCPEGSTTYSKGAKHIMECVCSSGNYDTTFTKANVSYVGCFNDCGLSPSLSYETIGEHDALEEPFVPKLIRKGV